MAINNIGQAILQGLASGAQYAGQNYLPYLQYKTEQKRQTLFDTLQEQKEKLAIEGMKTKNQESNLNLEQNRFRFGIEQDYAKPMAEGEYQNLLAGIEGKNISNKAGEFNLGKAQQQWGVDSKYYGNNAYLDNLVNKTKAEALPGQLSREKDYDLARIENTKADTRKADYSLENVSLTPGERRAFENHIAKIEKNSILKEADNLLMSELSPEARKMLRNDLGISAITSTSDLEKLYGYLEDTGGRVDINGKYGTDFLIPDKKNKELPKKIRALLSRLLQIQTDGGTNNTEESVGISADDYLGTGE